MTRQEILKAYDINCYSPSNGFIIANPGKFEGEPIYVPYFYDMVMNGFQDETLYDEGDCAPYDVFNVTDIDREQFPELQYVKTVTLYEDTQGFVYSKLD